MKDAGRGVGAHAEDGLRGAAWNTGQPGNTEGERSLEMDTGLLKGEAGEGAVCIEGLHQGKGRSKEPDTVGDLASDHREV